MLAPRGRRDADALAHRLCRRGALLGFNRERRPQLVLASDAARTMTTARGVWSHAEPQPRIVAVPSLYQAGPEDVVRMLQEVGDEVSSVMVVGHNPAAHQLAVSPCADADPKSTRLNSS